jgi:hypothetical protein
MSAKAVHLMGLMPAKNDISDGKDTSNYEDTSNTKDASNNEDTSYSKDASNN